MRRFHTPEDEAIRNKRNKNYFDLRKRCNQKFYGGELEIEENEKNSRKFNPVSQLVLFKKELKQEKKMKEQRYVQLVEKEQLKELGLL